jgi:2-hydroxychromene-2-carboxylate isomerase
VPKPPRFYFSLRSPYSWLTLHDLADRHPHLANSLEWHPYWDPDRRTLAALEADGGAFCYAPMSREKHLYILQDVRRLADERGLAVTWPVDRAPCWEIPHLACLVAARHGKLAPLATALTQARWQQGRDICDPATVADIATGLGLDGTEAAGAAADPELRAEGVAVLLGAYRDGVFGVPFFIQGTARYWGVDRLDAFAARHGAAPEPLLNPGDFTAPIAAGSDAGHAGGCG